MPARVSPKALLAANWKMNPVNAGDALDLVRGVLPASTSHPDLVEVAIFPPYPWLLGVAEAIEGTNVKLGAQDYFWEISGPYTGEVSPAMLRGWCPWVIIGHSERRAYLGETDDMVARKTAVRAGVGHRFGQERRTRARVQDDETDPAHSWGVDRRGRGPQSARALWRQRQREERRVLRRAALLRRLPRRRSQPHRG